MVRLRSHWDSTPQDDGAKDRRNCFQQRPLLVVSALEQVFEAVALRGQVAHAEAELLGCAAGLVQGGLTQEPAALVDAVDSGQELRFSSGLAGRVAPGSSGRACGQTR